MKNSILITFTSFNRWEYFIEGCLKINNINKKNLHVADVFSKLIKSSMDLELKILFVL